MEKTIKGLRVKINIPKNNVFCGFHIIDNKDETYTIFAIYDIGYDVMTIDRGFGDVFSVSVPLPTNQKLWDMAKVIVKKQKEAKKLKDDVDWDILEDDWFDWLGEEILGNAK